MAKLPCPPELWPAFSALLDAALEIPESERPRWLASLGSEHATVQPWLAKVLSNSPDSFDTPFTKDLIVSDQATSDFLPGRQIGPYRLHERLGSGGMGEVWLASRSDGTLKREVALKLPHTHLLAGVLRRRFERERDILADLSHPNIAQLYDAGVADEQHPYLAMELVHGASINEHCRDVRLSLDGRLDLFLQVLDAVGYAHARLIAHRDLKPSNILVTREQRVKLLDFGIAKLLKGDGNGAAAETQLTQVGSYMATPGYAAPEVAAGEPVTVAVDLYALGVILHELLTGHRPFRHVRNTTQVRAHTGRASTRVDPTHAKTVGDLPPKMLRRAISGDLDAIIAKALEPDPVNRYRTAEAFATDIVHSRSHRPIAARHIGPTTLAWKFIRRHRLGAAMTLTLLLLLVAGSVGIAWQAVRAEREAQRATLIKDFLIGVFRASDPRIAADKPRGEITARDLLDISAKQIERGFTQHPATQIELLDVTADIYRELDETQRSTALYARETELAQQFLGRTDVHTIDGLLGQAFNAGADGDAARALQLLDEADPRIHQAHLDKTDLRAQWLMIRGEVLFGNATRADDVRSSLETAAALFKAVAPQHPRYADTLIDLGSFWLERTNFAVSADYYRRAIDVAEHNSQSEGDLLLAYQGLALDLNSLGDTAGAAAAFERGANIAARTYGRDSHNYWMMASDWATFRYERGERETAFGMFDDLLKDLPLRQSAFRNAIDAVEGAMVLRKYGYCLAIDGQGAQSIQLLERARDWLPKSATHSMDTATLQMDLGIAYEAGGRIEEARNALRAALQAFEQQKASPWQLANAHERWGRFLLGQQDLGGAMAEFQATAALSGGRSRTASVLAQAGLAAVALARHDSSAAIEASGHAMSELEHLEDRFDVRIQPYVWGIRAEALLASGAAAAARELAQRSRDAAQRYYAPGNPAITRMDRLARAVPAQT